MRILLVNTYHFQGGGDSTYSFSLADLLQKKGHEVAFFAMKDERNCADSNSDLFISNIDFNEMNLNKSPFNGLRVLRRVIYSKEAREKFKALIQRFNPDIIHLQSIHHHITPSVAFEAKVQKIPVVWTLHDYKLACPNTHYLIDKTGEICEACGKYKYYQAILKRCKKNSVLASAIITIEAYAHRLLGTRNIADLFITPSQFLKNKLVTVGFPHEKVIHLPFFLSNNSLNVEFKNNHYFLFLGKLERIKGIYPLIAAFKAMPDYVLKLAGPVRDPIASQLSELLPPNIKYVGLKKGEELTKLISESTALILPSLCYENQPFSILEAFAASKPVIASDLGGMSELIKSSGGGILFPPGDVKALSETIRVVMMDERQAKHMGQAGYEYVQRIHTSQNHYEKLMEIYKRVLN